MVLGVDYGEVGNMTPFNSWPDLSDGTTISINSGRVTNVTKNKAKKIGTDVYIELAGDMSITTTSSGYQSWKLTDAIPIITDPCEEIDAWYKYDNYSIGTQEIRGFYIDESGCIKTTTYGAKTYTIPIDFKIVLHNQ